MTKSFRPKREIHNIDSRSSARWTSAARRAARKPERSEEADDLGSNSETGGDLRTSQLANVTTCELRKFSATKLKKN
jgi:hypothetical protein